MADRKEIFSTEIELCSYGQCSHCKGGEEEVGGAVIKLRDKTDGEIHLCRNCMGYYHIHVNAEPYMKPVRDPDPVTGRRHLDPHPDAAQERMDRIESEKHDAVSRQEERRRKISGDELHKKMVEDGRKRRADMRNTHGDTLAAFMGLVMLEKVSNVTFERTHPDGTTERLEVWDDISGD